MAARSIVENHQYRVAATIHGMVGPGHEAEDLGQETFVRFFRSLPSFRGDSAIATYLTRIAMNLCLNEIQKRRRWFWVREKIQEELYSESGLDLDSEEQKRQVRLAVLQLNPEQRAVVVLRWMEGHTVEQAAQILNIPLGTALSRLHRAHQSLKKIWSKQKESAHG